MRPEDEVVIHITKDQNIFVETKKKGIESYKCVEPNSVLDSLIYSIQHKLDIKSGLLPDNCIAFNGDESGNRFVALTYDKGCADISLEKTEYKDFPLPRLVFGFLLNKDGRIVKVTLGVTDRGRLTPKSKMYIYPLSNVSGFGLCIGSNSMPTIKSNHQLNGMPYFILSMPNNYDLYRESNTKLNLNLRELFEHLKDKNTDYYYTDVLIEMNKTLSDFINGGKLI